ncbi:MAG: ATP-binding protein, partial [Clostridiales bacterium]|nr:ATP-binding protein [Clostridiales bacterium]
NGNINLFIWKNLDNIVIEVVDSGVGIPKEKLSEIFHSFYQIENLYTRSSEGSGIGLSIIKEIVQIHGGKIEVESEVGEGSIFRIYIPINLENNIPDYNPCKIEDIKRKYNISKVVITHLEEDWGKSYNDYLKLECQYNGIQFAYDGMEIDVK